MDQTTFVQQPLLHHQVRTTTMAGELTDGRLSILRPIRPNLVSIHLSAGVRRTLTERFVRMAGHPYDPLSFAVMGRIATNILADVLPMRVVQAIRAAKHQEHGHLEITGTPTDPELIRTPTPGVDLAQEKGTFVPELFSMGIAGLLGQEVFNFRQEGWGTGALIFNIFPLPRLRSLKGAGGVTDDFRFHMENAWHPQSPDTLLLKGIRQDHDAVATTMVVGNAAILSWLTSEERELLRRPLFQVMPPEIHRRMEEESGILFNAELPYVGPVLVDGDQTLLINFNGMWALPGPDQEAATALLAKIERIAEETSVRTKLTPDNLLIVFNRRSIHTRSGYVPRFDGMDRWFQRYYLLEPHRLWRRLRVSEEDFPYLGGAERVELLAHLRQHGIVRPDGTLGSTFCPYTPQFGLPLPPALESSRVPVTKTLLDKGPAYPHAVV